MNDAIIRTDTPRGRFLTAQERHFIAGYTQGMTIKAAAKMAGYATAQAAALLEREDIAETVAALRIKMTQELGEVITRDYVGAMILEAHRKAVSATEEIAAARELAKLYGLNAPEKVVNVTYNVQRVEQLEAYSDADLARMAGLDSTLVAPLAQRVD